MTTGNPPSSIEPLEPIVPLADDDAMQALERFVVDNDDLLALEERIGRFNIFDALDITRVEIRHSNFLSWLLDPAESHGQGALFLNAILMDLFKKARADGMDIPLSPVELDGANLQGVDVRREWHNIDILIKCDQPRFVIAIENKIDSGERPEQLARYRKILKQHFESWPTLLVFLTREGDQPSDDQWCIYSYRDVFHVLSRTRKTQAKSIGEDVLTFLDHYLNLIESRFMNDPKIDDLCQRIYKNHKQAIDLIFSRRLSASESVIAGLHNWIQERPTTWNLGKQSPNSVRFCPMCWDSMRAPLHEDHSDTPYWLGCEWHVEKGKLYFLLLCVSDFRCSVV